MGQSYPIHACTRANHVGYSSARSTLHFAAARNSLLK